MLKTIQIIEKSSGLIVAEYPYIAELVEDVSEEEYCNDAWENAIDEGLVDEDKRSEYLVEIVEDEEDEDDEENVNGKDYLDFEDDEENKV